MPLPHAAYPAQQQMYAAHFARHERPERPERLERFGLADVSSPDSSSSYQVGGAQERIAALEDEIRQMAAGARYKAEFVAGLLGELCAPLNSLLILAKQLADNDGNTLSSKQVDFAQTIYATGSGLLSRIDDILGIARADPEATASSAAHALGASERIGDDEGRADGAWPFAAAAAAELAEAIRGIDRPAPVGVASAWPAAPGAHGADHTHHGVRSRRSDEPAARDDEADADGASWRRTADSELAGRKVLIIDNDVRNVFAMTSALEQQGMVVVQAECGDEGIAALRENPDTSLALINIRTRDAGGLDTISALRHAANWRPLVVIAVTSPEDREQCVLAGASDTLQAPVNVEQMLSLARTWLTHVR